MPLHIKHESTPTVLYLSFLLEQINLDSINKEDHMVDAEIS